MEEKLKRYEKGSTKISEGVLQRSKEGQWQVEVDRKVGERRTMLRDTW